jgi:hypothetical protein
VKIQFPGDPGAGQLHATPHRRVGHRRSKYLDQKIGRNIPPGPPSVHGREII